MWQRQPTNPQVGQVGALTFFRVAFDPARIRLSVPERTAPNRGMMTNRPELKIFAGSAHRALAESIARHVGKSLGNASVGKFPDGETRVQIHENVRGRDVFIVQPTCPPTNYNIMELLILVDAARRASAARITAVIPFFGYARQDRKDQPRVPITAKLVANLLTAAGVSRVLTLDLHAQQIQGFFDIPVDHLYAKPVFIDHFRQRQFRPDVVVSPDVGGLKMASAYALALHVDLAIVAKTRRSPTDVTADTVISDVQDRSVLIVDDLTESAGTLGLAADVLRKHGAQEIYAAVTHAVLSPDGYQKLQKSGIKELITSDSVPVKQRPGVAITVVSIAELLGDGILRIHEDESVSYLFEIPPEKTSTPT